MEQAAASTISIGAVFAIVRSRWVILLLATIAGAGLGGLAAWQLPMYFRAEIVLQPAPDLNAGSRGLSGLASQFGGLAAFAGINLGPTGTDRAATTLETVRGRTFLVTFARRRDLIVPLFAATGWDEHSQQWILNPSVYDAASKRWREHGVLSDHSEPSDARIYRKMSGMFKFDQDRRTGIIRITADSVSPRYAVQWAKLLVEDLNEYLRQKDSADAERTLEYLNREVRATSVHEMEVIFYRLIEEQTKTLMLTQVSKEYALKVIDPPIVPDRPVWPRPAWLVLLGAMAGFSAAAYWALQAGRRSVA